MSKQGCIMKIVKYSSNKNIIVEFQDKYKAKIHTGYQAFVNGSVKNPYHPTVKGIGYLGEGENVRVNGELIESYKVWFSMLDRCYKNNEKRILHIKNV